MSIVETIEQFLLKNNLIEDNNTVITAFSGGYDSMCLLDIIQKLAANYDFKPVAVHLNHNWRGEESDNEELNCRKFCLKHNIDFYSEKLPEKFKKNETSARKARYEFFQKCAEKYKSKCILTAHNADDNAETLIYRIAKGTGISGLEGIKERRGIFYRPLLNIYRKDIEAYCKENKLIPNNDSSNFNTKYKRNLIRHEIFPILQKINPDFKEAINSLSALAKFENEYFENIISSIEEKNTVKTEVFEQLPYLLKSRYIHNLYKKLNLDYDKEKIEYILNFIEENKNSKSGKTCSLTKDLWLFTSDKVISLVSNTNDNGIINPEIHINHCGQYTTGEYKFTIEEKTKTDKFPKDEEMTAIVDLSSYGMNLVLRRRKDGDIIKPYGVQGTQKLKKYLNNKKVPNHVKNSLLFLCCGKEVLWAPSLGISEKIKVKNNPTHILKLEKLNINNKD